MEDEDPEVVIAFQARYLTHLSNVNRLEIIIMLRDRELCVSHLAKALGMTDGGASQHLSRMRDAGIVAARRDAQNIYYRLTSNDAEALVRCAMEYASTSRKFLYSFSVGGA